MTEVSITTRRVTDRLRVAFTIVLGLAACLVADGCKRKPAALLFHAGAGQRSSLDEIASVFAARNPGVRVVMYLGHGKTSETPGIGAEVRVRIPRDAIHLFPAMGS